MIKCLKMRVQSKKLVHTSKIPNICFTKVLILFQYFQILLCLCCFCCKKKNTDDLKPVKMKSKKSSPYPDDGYPVENLIVTQNPTNSNGGGSSGQPPNYQSIRHNIHIRTVSSQYMLSASLNRFFNWFVGRLGRATCTVH